ncbi:fatty-acid amide hydrolase 1-like, partial [Clarias magur]
LIPFTHPRIVTTYNELCMRGLQADGGVTLLKQLKEGPIDPCIWEQVKNCRRPKFIKKMMSLLCRFT